MINRIAWAVPLLLVVFGCKTTSIGQPLSITIPRGLSNSDAEIAIVTMLSADQDNKGQPPKRTTIVTDSIGAMLWDQYCDGRTKSKLWFLESWDGGEIVAGYQRRMHYLRVRVKIYDSEVTLEIDSSRHLSQTESRIHQNAKIWVEMLETDIRNALGRALVIRNQIGQQRGA